MSNEWAGLGLGGWTLDVPSRTFRWSPELGLILAIDPDPVAPVTLAAWAEFVHPADRTRVIAELEAVLASASARLEQRLRIVRPNGSVCELLMRGRLDRAQPGAPGRISGVAVDLTAGPSHGAADSVESRRLADAMPHLVWTAEAGGAVVHCSSRIADYEPAARDEDGTYRWQALVHPDDLAATAAAWQEAQLAQATYGFEHRLRMADGSWRWHLSRAVPAHDTAGRLVAWYGTATDINAVKSAELKATNELEQLEAIYRAAPVGLCLLDRDLRIVRINEALAATNGRTVEDHLGRSVWEIVPSIRTIAEPIMWQVLATGQPVTDVEIVGETAREPGLQHHWIEQFYPIAGRDGTVSHIGVICEEVTERRRVELALRESEARFRSVADTAPAMLWITGVDQKTIFLSRGWYDYTGQPQDEALGFGWLPMIHPEDREETRRRYVEAAGRREPFNLDYRLRRADGQYRWVIDAGRPRVDADGEFAGFVGSVIDVHERKEAEERQTLLMREVDHRAKNALAVVQSVIRLTRADDPKDFVAIVEGRIGAIAHAHTLLAESSWTSASLRGLLERELAAYGLERIEFSGEDVVLHPEAAQPFALATHELATNAAKYGALSRPAGRLHLSWQQDAGAHGLRLTWRESGGPAVRPPTRLSFGSTLIGLAVREQIGGTVEKSWQQRGLVCEPFIPKTRLAGSNPRPRASAAAAGRAARVLVVEDDMLIALDIVAMLSRFGQEVVGPAGSVAEALDILADEPVDAAIVDANLNGVMATAIAERLAALRVPFIVATGYGKLPEQAFAGAPILLNKPFSADALRQVLAPLLARRAG